MSMHSAIILQAAALQGLPAKEHLQEVLLQLLRQLELVRLVIPRVCAAIAIATATRIRHHKLARPFGVATAGCAP